MGYKQVFNALTGQFNLVSDASGGGETSTLWNKIIAGLVGTAIVVAGGLYYIGIETSDVVSNSVDTASAERVISVDSVPSGDIIFGIGQCSISCVTNTEAVEDLNCNDDTAIILLDGASTTTSIATDVASLSNVTDPNLGAITLVRDTDEITLTGATPDGVNDVVFSQSRVLNSMNIFSVDGNVGIGSASPSATLDVTGTAKISDSLQIANAIVDQGSASYYSGDASLVSSNTFTFDTAYGSAISLYLQSIAEDSAHLDTAFITPLMLISQSAPDSTGDIGWLYGGSLSVDHLGSGTVGDAVSFNNFINVVNGTVTQGRGMLVSVASSNDGVTSGTLTTGIGLDVKMFNYGGTFTNAYGAKISKGYGTDTITDFVGLAIDNISSATNQVGLLLGTTTKPSGNYSLYSSSSNDSYFAGNVGIGTTAPAQQLEVGDGTNSFLVKADGEINLIGTARVSKNEWIKTSGLKLPGTKPAEEVDWGINGGLEFSDSTDDTVCGTIRLPQDMDKTIAPAFKIGWASDTADPGDDSKQVVWQLEYLFVSQNEDTTGAAQETLETTTSASTTVDGLTISTITGIDLPSATDQLMIFRIKRLGADADDDLGDDCTLLGTGLQYTSDKLGVAL